EAETGVSFINPVLDTLLLSAVAHPDRDDHSMEAIAARLGVNMVGRHTALGDALVTAEIFVKLLPLLKQKGIVTLKQAREAAEQSYLARVQYG
ncbi:MAG: exonuclease domain-containing protein, partial [Caldilineaceae bacterium]